MDVDNLVSALQARVETRRQAGDYPPGLEEELEAEFAIIMAAVHRDEVNTSELGRRVAAVERSSGAVRALGETGSRIPGGAVMHTAAARLVARHTGEIATSVRALGIDVARALHEVHHLIDLQRSADERQLHDVVGSLIDRLAVIDHLADAVVHLESRVQALEKSLPPQS